MKWPWQRVENHAAPENRATLTLLPDMLILGLPHGTPDDMAAEAMAAARRLSETNHPPAVVFPYPIDVIDCRDGTR